jgi:hypothetical protein
MFSELNNAMFLVWLVSFSKFGNRWVLVDDIYSCKLCSIAFSASRWQVLLVEICLSTLPAGKDEEH